MVETIAEIRRHYCVEKKSITFDRRLPEPGDLTQKPLADGRLRVVSVNENGKSQRRLFGFDLGNEAGIHHGQSSRLLVVCG